MKITIIGTGYVGLVTGTCLANSGNEILCIDNNVEKVQLMKKGVVPIYEPHLEFLFEKNIHANRLSFSTSLEEGLDFADVIFLALPTPEGEDGSADLSYVLSVGEQIGKLINNYKIIVSKSTVPVGTCELLKQTIQKNTNIPFDIVSNPEFLREGFAIEDFMKPERIIIGSESEKAIEVMKQIFQPFVTTGNPIIIMDNKSAELTKYAANAFLATKITFMNEVANFSEIVGADVDKVRLGIGSDSRIGNRFLFPGVGFGGSCFPKDVKALFNSGKKEGYDFKVLKSVIEANQIQKKAIIPKILNYFETDNLKGKKIAIWGLAFKPETDDMREASSIVIIKNLLDLEAEIHAFDPEANENFKKLNLPVSLHDNMYEVIQDADALVICTEWNVFKAPDFQRIKELMNKPVIFDGRNLYSLNIIQKQNIYYNSIGRSVVDNLG